MMEPLPGKSYCFFCKCEVEDCDKGRNKQYCPSARFCFGHHRTLVTSGDKYANAFGQQQYDPSWNEELRLTARLAFLLNRVPPQDLSSFLDFARRICIVRKGELEKSDIVWMILASALKWPHAVEVFWENMSSLLDAKPTADTVCRCVAAAIRSCDGKEFKEMHAEISVTGRAAAVSGPKWLGNKLGLLHTPNAASSQKKKCAEEQRGFQPPQTVALGRKQRQWRLLAKPLDARQGCQHVIDVVEHADIVWPDTNDRTVMTRFAENVIKCVRSALHIGRDEDKALYSAVGVARKIILYVTDFVPDAFDKCRMEVVMDWTCDQGGHAGALKHLSGRQVRTAFGLQPVMVPCWTCFFGACNGDALTALRQASDKRLLEILADLNKQGNLAPGPHTIAKVLLGRSALKARRTGD